MLARTAPPYPVNRARPPAPISRVDIPSIALAVSIVGWFAAVALPLIWRSTPDLEGVGDDALRFVPFAAIAVLVADVLCLNRLIAMMKQTFDRGHGEQRWLVLICTGLFLASFALGRPNALLYVGVMFVLGMTFRMFWSISPAIRIPTFQAVAMIAAISTIVPLLLYGLPSNRWVGGIHPNAYGGLVITLCIFSVLGFPRIGWLLIFPCLVLATLVSSRYAVLTLLTISCLLISKNNRLSFSMKTMAAIWAVIGAICLVLLGVVSNVFALDDANRGLGSGLTGRTGLWAYFWPRFSDAPWLGAGFRSHNLDVDEGVHNGYLQLFLDNGAIIGFGIVLWVFMTILLGFVRSGQRNVSHERITTIAGFFGVALGSAFQPQLINFGDTTGITFLLLLMCPLAYNSLGKSSLQPAAAPLPRAGRPQGALRR